MKKLIELAGYYQKADPALAITLKFVFLGMLWILFSDSLLFVLGSENNILWKLSHIHILKGLAFVGITGGFIFYWTNQYVNSLQKREAEVKNLFEASPIPMGIMDASTLRLLEINNALIKQLELSPRQTRALDLTDLVVDRDRFETVPLLIRTGVRELGAWQFKKGNVEITVDLSAQPIRDRRAFLIIFTDVTDQLRNSKEVESVKMAIRKSMDEKIEQLAKMNEELAYRASQTEHVNAELISVNEQLQYVNKKVALRAEESAWKLERMNSIASSLSDAYWCFDLTGKTKPFVSSSAYTLYEESCEKLLRPWFWLDYIHPDDLQVRESAQAELMEKGISFSCHRIITASGAVKTVLSRLRIIEHTPGASVITGCVTDISARRDLPGPILPGLRSSHNNL